MEWLEWVIKIGGVITALGVIWAAVTTAVKKAINKMLSNLNEKIDGIEKHCRENYLTSLRLTIMSSDMPHGERVCAARDYIEEGGNGDVKKFAINELHINDVHREEH